MSGSDDNEESSSTCSQEWGDCRDIECNTHRCELCGEILYACKIDTCINAWCKECYKLCECDDRPSNRNRPSQIMKREALYVACQGCKVRCPPNTVFKCTTVIRDKENKVISNTCIYDSLCEKCRIEKESKEKEKDRKRNSRLSHEKKKVTRLEGEIDALKKTLGDEKLLLENENTVLKEELKRKRSDEDMHHVVPDDTIVDGEVKTKECMTCRDNKPVSFFKIKSYKKNKEGKNVEYNTERDICHSCNGKKYRNNKKTKVSK